MTDYRKLLGVDAIAEAADYGRGVKVAVVDTGIPLVDSIPVVIAEDFTPAVPGRSGDVEHATAVGSILFGDGVVQGICPRATSCFAKVFQSAYTARPEAVATAVDCAAFLWGADIINLSLGFSGDRECSPALKAACERAIMRGVVIVASAGNDGGSVMWPAALQGVVSVGAFRDDGDGRESYSNCGKVDVVAPGTDMLVLGANGFPTTRSGTSYSTAAVSGLLALLLARRRIKDPSARACDVKDELLSMCVDLGAPGMDAATGHGCPFRRLVPRKSIFSKVMLSLYTFFAIIKENTRKAMAALKPRRKKTNEKQL